MPQYVMLIADDTSVSVPESEANAIYEKIGAWWGEHAAAGRIVGGHQLQGAETATTIRLGSGKALITDGPFVESKEVIGGYGVLEVPDLDAAIALAKSWPAPNAVLEVRPVVDHAG
jgi:hypothetical protein